MPYNFLRIGRPKKRKKADRRAGRVPHVGRQPRARTKKGSWRKKRKDTGKKRKRRGIWIFVFNLFL